MENIFNMQQYNSGNCDPGIDAITIKCYEWLNETLN